MTTDDRLVSGASSESSLPPNKSSGDIVERLRERRGVLDNRWPGPTTMDLEAAAEIERLRREVAYLEALAENNDRSATYWLGQAGNYRWDAEEAKAKLLTAALAAMWQPIETAPIGRSVLLWWTPVTPNKHAESSVVGTVSEHEAGKWWNGNRCQYEDLDRITHWMPLPPAPTQLSTGMGSEKTAESGHSAPTRERD